jgi:hypothetical protein
VFSKFSNSWSLAKSSCQMLREEKQLVIFPILSGLACLLIMISFAVPFFANPALLDFLDAPKGQVQVPLWVYLATFAFYFCTYFVVIFFNSALVGCAVLRFNGQEAGLGDGMQIAISRLPQILAWALVSATVGLLLKLIESVHERVGQIVAWLLGTAWTVITYFVVPVLVVEKLGPIQSIHRSVDLLKKTWGEALVGKLGIGLILFLLLLPGLALFALGVVAAGQSTSLAFILIGTAVVYFLIWSAVSSAINVIFLAALYQYASTGTAPGGFDQEIMAGAFAPKSAS